MSSFLLFFLLHECRLTDESSNSALATSAYAISFFLPIILRENMDFSIGEAQYLSAPPYVLACIVMWVLAWVGDKYRVRGPLLFVNCLLGIIGGPLLVSRFSLSLSPQPLSNPSISIHKECIGSAPPELTRD